MPFQDSGASARRTALAAALVSAFSTIPAIAAPGDPLGPEFSVSDASSGAYGGQIARNGAGATVVVYCAGGVKAQRLDAIGTRIGTPIAITPICDSQNVAIDAAGDFVVTWQYGHSIFARRFAADGTVRGDIEVLIDARATLLSTDVAMDADGDFIVAWGRLIFTHIAIPIPGQPYGSIDVPVGSNRIEAQRYRADGTANGGVVQVGIDRLRADSSYEQVVPSVAMDADGDSMVVWQSETLPRTVYARRVPKAGTIVAPRFIVSTGSGPQVGLDAAGNAHVVWTQSHPVGRNSFSGYDYYTRRYAAGSMFGGPKIKVTQDVGTEGSARIATNAAGESAVGWTASSSNGCCIPRQMSVQRVAADGTLVGANRAFPNTIFANNAGVGIDDSANFLFTWDYDGSIRAQLLSGY